MYRDVTSYAILSFPPNNDLASVQSPAWPTKRCIVVMHPTADLWCTQYHVIHMTSDAQNHNNPLVPLFVGREHHYWILYAMELVLYRI